ncbi:MAG: RluA family pseudouridine synthase [Candidatus Shapirobacteria bacterium]
MFRKKRQENLPKIIFEDSRLLVIDKPYFWATLRDLREKTELQKWLEKEVFFAEEKGIFKRRSGIVHRLDKETSGLLLVAKNSKDFKDLQEQFANRQVKKEYFALAKGETTKEGIIQAPIKRQKNYKNKWRVYPMGKSAKTSYERLNIYIDGGQAYSLLKVKPETGRTHQIRVHLKYLGFPLAGDQLYSSSKDKKLFPRLFLHASFLSFKHPQTEKIISINSPIPYELVSILAKLKEKK